MPQLRGLPKAQWASPTPYKAHWKAFKKRWKEQYIPEVTEPFEFDWGALERPEEAGRLGLAQAKAMIAGASMPMHMKAGAIARKLSTKLVRRYPGKIRDIKDVRPIVRDLMKRMKVKGAVSVEDIPGWQGKAGSYKHYGKSPYELLPHRIEVKTRPAQVADKAIRKAIRKAGFYYGPKWQRYPRSFLEDTMLHEPIHARINPLLEKVLPYRTRIGRKSQEAITEALTAALKKWAFLKRVPR